LAKNSEHALQQMKESLAHLVQSSFMAEDNNNNNNDNNNNRKDTSISCFDFAINRRLMRNTPVRKVSNYKATVEEAISILIQISADFADICCVGIMLNSNSNLQRTWNALKRISFSHTNSNILVRSVIALNLYFSNKIHGQYNFI
jgi:hypothetical protein